MTEHRTVTIGPDDKDKHVTVIVEDGGHCVVTVEMSNCYNTYACPPWMADEGAVARIIDRIKSG